MVFLESFIQLGLYLILLTPLLYSFHFIAPFIAPKVLAFQVLTDLVVCASVSLSLLRIRHRDSVAAGSLSLQQLVLPLALFIYLCYSVVTAFFSIDPGRSLWDSIEQQNGLILQTHFFAWMVVLAWFYRRRAESVSLDKLAPKARKHKAQSLPGKARSFHSYLRFSFWISTAVAFSAVYQWLEQQYPQLGLIPDSVQREIGGRVAGVFGNPTFLGPYLLFHFFYGLYLITRPFHSGKSAPAEGFSHLPKHGSKRGFQGIKTLLVLFALCIIVVSIILGQTRGVILGLAAGMVIAALSLAVNRSIARPIKASAIVVLILAIVGPVIALQFADAKIINHIPFLKRIAETSAEDPNVAMRLILWKNTLRGFVNNPLIGCGTNNLYYELNKHYDPVLASLAPSLVTQDKPHNAYLEVLAEKGIFGTMLYLALIIAAARSLLLMRDRYLAYFLFGGFSSHLIANVFAFNSFGSLFGVFLFLTPLVLSDLEATPDNSVKFHELRKEKKWFMRAVQKASALCAIALSVWSLYLNAQIGMANQGYFSARLAFKYDPNMGMIYYEEAFRHHSPYEMREKLYCTRSAVENLANNKINVDPVGCLRRVERYISEVAPAYPDDPLVFMTLADEYRYIGDNIKEEVLSKQVAFGNAETFALRALELSPNNQDAVSILSQIYLQLNQPARARELNRRMLAAYPESPIGHWFIGLSLYQDQKVEEAKREIEEALKLGFTPSGETQRQQMIEIIGEQE